MDIFELIGRYTMIIGFELSCGPVDMNSVLMSVRNGKKNL